MIVAVDVSIKYTTTGFSKDKIGTTTLKVRKDRSCMIPKIQKYTMGGDGSGRFIFGPQAVVEYGVGDHMPDKYQHALAALDGGPLSENKWRLAAGVSSKRAFADTVKWLSDNGHVERTQAGWEAIDDGLF